MKKINFLLIFFVVALCSTSLFAQDINTKISAITNEIIDAYKTQNREKLAKYASFYIKGDITDSKDFWKQDDVKKDIEEAKGWDGTIRGIHYNKRKLGKKIMYSALVYLYDAPESGKIYSLSLTKFDDGNWFMTMMGGIEKIKKSQYDGYFEMLDDFIDKVDNAVKKRADN